MKKITVIGIGHVGTHVASSLMTMNVCNEIALIDINENVALSQSIDLYDMSAYIKSDALVYLGDYSDLDNSDIIVISACQAIAVEDRLIEIEGNVAVMDEIISHIVKSKFNGVIISISNPCDIIAQYIAEKTKMNVIGTGTMLDSARLKARLGKLLGVSSKSINGYILGEHGNSQMAAYSLTSVNGIALKDYIKLNDIEIDLKGLEEDVNKAGWNIFVGKNSTEYGIGAACAYLATAVLNDENKVLPCSTYLEEYGVYASVPCIIGEGGVKSRIKFELTAKEQKAFLNSINVLKENYKRTK